MLDRQAAQAFLATLGTPPFVFQTFTDNKEDKKKHKRDPLARVLVGTLEQHWSALSTLSTRGAGIFVQINAGAQRGEDAIVSIRSLVIDLDQPDTLAESVASLQKYMPRPTAIVATSQGKRHIYWRVTDCPNNKYSVLQKSLALTFGGDTSISNLDRVMRLPGFPHQKGVPTPVTATLTESTFETLTLARAASKAPIMAATASKATASNSSDVFGLGMSATAYETPDVLAPGDRTHKMVQHAGYLSSQGFSEQYIRDELSRMNVSLCPKGAEPITPEQLEAEVFTAVARFVQRREQESPHTPAPAPAPPPPPSAEPLTPDTNMEGHTLDKWVERFLFIEEGSRIADRHRAGEHAIYQYQEFQRKYSNVFVGAEGKLCNKWIASPLRQDVRTTTYVPKAERLVETQGVKMWNMYCPSDIVASEVFDPALIAPFIRHLKLLFPVEASRELFLDWMAMTVTKPEIRIPWAPLLISPPGAGKGLIYEAMWRMMGEHNCNMINPERLENQFNGFVASSTLVCIDEMRFSAKVGVSDKLKNLITEPKIEINLKGIQERNARVFANVMIFSNHINSAYVETGDRRFWVHRIDCVPPPAHFEEVWNAVRDTECVANLLHWLFKRNLKGFAYTSHPPMTEAKQEMIEAGKSQIELMLEDAIEFRQSCFAADVVSYPTVVQFVLSQLGETSLGKSEGLVRNAWSRQAKALPRTLSRATLQIGDHKQVRVRVLRNFNHWSQASKKSIGHEATRAAQMLLTPNDVNDREMEVVSDG